MVEPVLPSYLAEGAPFRIFIVVLVGIALAGGLVAEIAWHKREEAAAQLRTIRVYAWSIALPLLLIGSALELIEFYDRARNPAMTTLMSPAAVWPAMIGAIALYWTRGVLPVLYGILEIMVGIFAVALAANYPAISAPAQLLAVAAGVYIVIRGLDNIDKGLSPGPQRKWRAFWQWPKRQPLIDGETATPDAPLSAEVRRSPDVAV